MAYGIAPDPKLYNDLWYYISWLNGGNVFLNRQGEGFDSKYPDLVAVASYCARGGIYVDYCGWPMYYDHRGGNANRNRFKQFISYVGADPNYCDSFTPQGYPGCFSAWPYRYGWVTGINAYIPPVTGGGRLAASYEAPSDACTGPGGLKRWAYSAVGVRVYSGGQFKGWYFWGVGDGWKSLNPPVYARFIKQCVSAYPPPGGGGGDQPEVGCDPDKCVSEPILRYGSSGNCVGWVQRRLKQLGYAPGPTDCIFGWQTEAAVKQFQKDRGLVVDGVVGPQTWAALKGAVDGGGISDEERCRRAGGVWDPVNGVCKAAIPPPVPEEKDYLLYALIGGAAVATGIGIYLLVRR